MIVRDATDAVALHRTSELVSVYLYLSMPTVHTCRYRCRSAKHLSAIGIDIYNTLKDVSQHAMRYELIQETNKAVAHTLDVLRAVSWKITAA